MNNTPTQRLAELGLELPTPPAPAALYTSCRRVGQMLFVAGQLPFVEGELPARGRVGADVDQEQAYHLARIAGLNSLAVASATAGGLDALVAVNLLVFVSSAPDFFEQHLVANGASSVLLDVLGDSGAHSRTAVAAPCLPLNSPVEVQATYTVVGP